MSRTLRLIFTVTLALTLLLAVATGAIAVLLGTDSGTRLLAAKARDFAGGTVAWTRLEGTLLGPLRIEGLQLQQPGLEATVEELEVDWRPLALVQRRVQVDSLAIKGVKLALTTAAESPDTTAFNPGDLALPIRVGLAGATLTELEVTTDDGPPLRVQRVELAARLEAGELAIRAFTLRLPEGGLSLSGQVGLATAMPVTIDSTWDWLLADAVGPDPVPLAGNASLNGTVDWGQQIGFDLGYRLAATGLEALENGLPAEVEITGKVEGTRGAAELQLAAVDLALSETHLALSLSGSVETLDTDEPRANLELQWQGLQWPLHGEEVEFTSRQGSISLAGVATGFNLALHGELLSGSLSIGGDATLEPAIRWRLGVDGRDLNPAQLQPDLPGSLAIKLRTEGEIDPAGNPQIELWLEELHGTLADLPLRVNAHATVAGEAVDIVVATLESQGNSLQASGRVSADRLALDFQAAAPNPGALLAGAGGELSATGTVSGSTDLPQLQVAVSGEKLSLDNFRITSLISTVSAGLAREDPLQLDLAMGPLVDGEQQLLAGLQITGRGTTGEHQLTATLDAGDVQVRARLEGGPDEAMTTWLGVLRDLSLETTSYGQWVLNSSPALSLAAARASLKEICLQATTGAGRVCGAGTWTAEGASEFGAQVQDLPLNLFAPAISGAIDGKLTAELAAKGDLAADGRVTLDPGEIRVDDSRKLPHGGGQLALQIDQGGLQAQLQLTSPADGRLEARARLPALTALPLAGVQPLEGALSAELPDLAGLAAWVPELGRTAGRLKADLQLGGSLADPQLAGALSLENGSATLPTAGVELQDITLRAAGAANRSGKLVLTGGLHSGPGRLELEGLADMESGELELALTGDRLEVYNTPDARALLSPDVQVAWRDNTLNLRGRVAVPEAELTPKIRRSPAARGQVEPAQQTPGEPITPSPDVVVVSENLEVLPGAGVPEAPFRIDSRLRLEMGDKVRVRAVGLVSRITGAVDFTNTPEQEALIPLATGRVSLEDGTFRAFGQDLEIETGQLIFANVPANQPEINLRAVRWIDNDPQVTAAGVQVTGPLEQPVLELFSRPQLETSEIQSYLLTGSSPRSRDNVLGIGTYVSRKIYVGYGYNMLEKTSEFNSLFNISPRYGVGSSVGEADNNINMTITYEH